MLGLFPGCVTLTKELQWEMQQNSSFLYDGETDHFNSNENLFTVVRSFSPVSYSYRGLIMLSPHHCGELNLFTLSLSAGKKEHILFPV